MVIRLNCGKQTLSKDSCKSISWKRINLFLPTLSFLIKDWPCAIPALSTLEVWKTNKKVLGALCNEIHFKVLNQWGTFACHRGLVPSWNWVKHLETWTKSSYAVPRIGRRDAGTFYGFINPQSHRMCLKQRPDHLWKNDWMIWCMKERRNVLKWRFKNRMENSSFLKNIAFFIIVKHNFS